MTRTIEGLRNRQDAQNYFRRTAPSKNDEPTSSLERALRHDSIVSVDLGLDPETFQQLSDQYGCCIDEFPDSLDLTAGTFDANGVPEDGHVRKDIGFNTAGMQISDPKSLFHFNTGLVERVCETDMLDKTPREFREFMEHGIELHRILGVKAKNLIKILDSSYDTMSELYFPSARPLGDVTFRLLRYDGYGLYDDNGRQTAVDGEQVAKAHYDRGGATIQAYASAPGFWIHSDPVDGSKRKATTQEDKHFPAHGGGQSQLFFGAAHRMIYGSQDPIRQLYHGVDRIVDVRDAELRYMPARTAAIVFVDAPLVNMRITSQDTQPDRVDKNTLNI